MKKKFLLSLMLICISIFTLGMISVYAETVASGTCGTNANWVLDDAGTLTISGTGNMDNYKSKGSGNQSTSPWNDYREQIEKVKIESGISNVGNYAFYDCQKLASAEIPDGVTKVGERAFCRCFSLLKVNIPSSVTEIGFSAFAECRGLRKIVIPDSVTQMGDYVFSGCSTLEDVTLSKKLTELKDQTFSGCSALTEINLHEGLTEFGSCVFKGTNIILLKCPSTLKTVKYDTFWESGIQEIELPEGLNEFPQFTGCKKLKKMKVPNGTTAIPAFSFYMCYALEEIEIPPSVKTIGGGLAETFGFCQSLKKVYISDLEAWCDIVVDNDEANPLCYGAKLYLNNQPIETLVIPDGVKKIEAFAFQNCTDIKCVIIPKSVEAIKRYAFSGCTNIETVFYDGTQSEFEENVLMYAGNDIIENATIKSGYDVKLITENNEESSITCFPGKKIKLSAIKKKYKHEVTLYSDKAMTNEFDTSTAITDNLTLYVKLGEEITYMPGDLNGDDKVTDDDVIYLMYHIFFAADYPVNQDCDFNNDDAVTDDDVIYLMYHIFFPEEYPIN